MRAFTRGIQPIGQNIKYLQTLRQMPSSSAAPITDCHIYRYMYISQQERFVRNTSKSDTSRLKSINEKKQGKQDFKTSTAQFEDDYTPEQHDYDFAKQRVEMSQKHNQTVLRQAYIPIISTIIDVFRDATNLAVGHVVGSAVERQFSLEQFRKDVIEGFKMITTSQFESDFSELQDALSSKQYAEMKRTANAFEAQNVVTDVSIDKPQSYLISVTMLPQDQVSLPNGWVHEPVPVSSNKTKSVSKMLSYDNTREIPRLYLSISVLIKHETTYTYSDSVTFAKLGSMTDCRDQIWQFVRGPIPIPCPVQELESKWFVQSIKIPGSSGAF